MSTKTLSNNFRQAGEAEGVSQETLSAIASHLEVSETRAIQFALARLYRDLMEEDPEFDYPAADDPSAGSHEPPAGSSKRSSLLDDIKALNQNT